MFHPNQLTIGTPTRTNTVSTPESSALKPVDRNDLSITPHGEIQDQVCVGTIIGLTKKLQDDLQKLGLKIKHHEENLKFLKAKTNSLEESILDMQVSLGKYHSSAETGNQNVDDVETEQNTIEQILRQEKTAAGIFCQLKTRHGTQSSQLQWTKDVVGIVATLGKVHDDNLSRLFSEFLGLETMLAIVCKTNEAVKSLEMYDREGRIDKGAGLHGLGPSIARPMEGRFLVICLEDLRPYVGEFLAEDPQKRLVLMKPRLPSGERPAGFLDFAVNMIDIDNMNLSCLTSGGHGLRETLFYSLFSRLQVYKTRVDMQLAVPCISHGAISLDGGMIKSTGLFSLGSRKDVEVRFPTCSGKANIPEDIIKSEEQIRFLNWEKERIDEDMKREEALLRRTKNSFDFKKQELLKFLGETSSIVGQVSPNPGWMR